MANTNLFHCSIKIISRAKGQSAVASAAYRAGAELHNAETGKTHNYTKKREVVHSEIILPDNAPAEYANRETLWNSVQSVETKANSTLAREVEVAFPLDMTQEQRLECIRNYIRENFTSKGMIADFSIHDKDGNPHAHIMLTCRDLDKNHRWVVKSKSVFANDYDEQDKPCYNPAIPCYNPKDKANTEQYRIPMLDEKKVEKWESEHGRRFDVKKDRKYLKDVQAGRERPGKGTEYKWYKVNIDTNDWNDQKNAEIWRKSWADNCNKYLADDKKIDHRSYKRQGLEVEPTIHEGYVARQMERIGKTSDRCETNREIKELNEITVNSKKTKRLIKIIAEKARVLYERIRRIGGITDKSQQSRRIGEPLREVDAGEPRIDGRIDAIRGRIREFEGESQARRRLFVEIAERATEDNRQANRRKQYIDGTKRHTTDAKSNIDATEQYIEEANRYFEELRQRRIKAQKVKDEKEQALKDEAEKAEKKQEQSEIKKYLKQKDFVNAYKLYQGLGVENQSDKFMRLIVLAYGTNTNVITNAVEAVADVEGKWNEPEFKVKLLQNTMKSEEYQKAFRGSGGSGYGSGYGSGR